MESMTETEEKIILAATDIFLEKGKDGARQCRMSRVRRDTNHRLPAEECGVDHAAAWLLTSRHGQSLLMREVQAVIPSFRPAEPFPVRIKISKHEIIVNDVKKVMRYHGPKQDDAASPIVEIRHSCNTKEKRSNVYVVERKICIVFMRCFNKMRKHPPLSFF